ncbi:MAG: tetratricopeptide repeat protein, partial [Acidobacteriota bacterium]
MARSQIATLLLAGLLLPAIGAADSPAVDLVRGDSRTALVAPGAVHQYAAKLAAGDFLHVIVDQEKIDLVVTAIDPSGQRLLEVDNPYGRDVAESVAFLAEVTGTHTLEIRPYPSAPAAGSYDLIVEAWRPATAADRKRATAEAATNAAHRRAARRTESDRRAAIKGYRAARELWQGLDERAEETRIVRRIGQLLRRVGESDAALGMLQEALALARESSNPAGVAKTLNEIGRVHRQKGANDRAIAAYRDALELWRELGETAQASRVLNNLGAAWMASGDLRQALPYYQQALNLFRQSGDRRRQATALANLGVLHDRLGRIDLAAASYEEALELCAALGRPDLEADVLNNLGVTLDQLGEPYEALESYAAARKIYRKLGDQSRQAAALNSQASLLLDLGRPDEARRLLVSATALLNEAGDPYLETRVLLNSGVVARELDEPSTALDRFSKALDHARRADDRDAEAHALYHQAVIRQRTGEGQLAHDLAQRALALFRRAGDVRGEARALRVAGRSAAILGRTESARRVSHQAIDLAARIADVTEQALGWQELGRLERDAGDPRLALEHFEAALTHFESRRAKISGQALRASHFTAVRATYDLAIDTSMQLHWKHPAAGFDRRGLVLSEQARARGLLDALIRAQVDVDDASTPAASDVDAKNRRDLQARAKNLRRQLNGLAHERRETLSDEASGDPMGDRIDVLMAEYRLLEGRLEPPTDIAVRGPAITPHLFEEIVELLDSDTVL